MPAWLHISCPGNDGTGHFSYQLYKTAQLPFEVHIISWEIYSGTANELSKGKEDFW